jgi:hypothetical protein
MALDVTRRLRQLDPADPVKYDFALHRMGLLKRNDELRSLVRGNPRRLRGMESPRLRGSRDGPSALVVDSPRDQGLRRGVRGKTNRS